MNPRMILRSSLIILLQCLSVTAGPYIQVDKIVAADDGDDLSFDAFGTAIAMDGTKVVVGAPSADQGADFDSGAVYVFDSTNSTQWIQEAKLTAPDGSGFDRFGYSVAVSNDTIVVGAHLDDVDSVSNAGSVHVFTSATGEWLSAAMLTASDFSEGARFGESVAIYDDLIVVGAVDDDGVARNAGAAYVFRKINGAWFEEAKLIASDFSASDNFGVSVAVWGDRIVVGASLDDLDGVGFDAGSAYVFAFDGSTWVEEIKLTASDAQFESEFGWRVAINEDKIVVGADYHHVGSEEDAGATYIFELVNSVWVEKAILVSPTPDDVEFFGISVDISPTNKVVVGARSASINNVLRSGAAFVFEEIGGVWSLTASLYAEDGGFGDNFGGAVAIGGDEFVAVGAFSDNEGAIIDAGSAYIFSTLADPPCLDCDAELPVIADQNPFVQLKKIGAVSDGDSLSFDAFGTAIAMDGTTLVVGAPTADVGTVSDAGAVYVFDSTDRLEWTQEAKLIAPDGDAFDRFGYSVALYGDTIVVGAHLDDIGMVSNAGSAYIYTSVNGAWLSETTLIASDFAEGARFGESVAIYEDVIVVGAVDDNAAALNSGAAYVFRKNEGLWLEEAKLVVSEATSGDNFGVSVDVWGDRIVVGASLDDLDGVGFDAGSVYVFMYDGSTWIGETQLVASDAQLEAEFGWRVAIMDDTIVVGADYQHIGSEEDAGAAYIYKLVDSLWIEEAILTSPDPNDIEFFGMSVDIANGNTVVIGARRAISATSVRTGAAFVFTKTNGVWSLVSTLEADDGEFDDNFGGAVAVGSDLIAVGAYGDDNSGGVDAGAVYVFESVILTDDGPVVSPTTSPTIFDGLSDGDSPCPAPFVCFCDDEDCDSDDEDKDEDDVTLGLFMSRLNSDGECRTKCVSSAKVDKNLSRGWLCGLC